MPSSTPEFSIELARPVDEHARQVMDWRNDPTTLASFFHREPKVWERFRVEFETDYFRDPLSPIFIQRAGKRVAFLRFHSIAHPFEAGRRCSDISINVDPALRGQALGVTALEMAAEFLKSRGVDDVLAEIRVENTASVRVFEKAGYVRVDQTIRHVEDTGEDCPIFRYLLRMR